MKQDPDTLEIGVVRRAHGIRGALRVQLHDPRSEALEQLDRVLLGEPGRSYVIDGLQDLGGGGYLLELAGVEDRNAAEALRGLPLRCLRAELPALSDDEFYIGDLVGCAVLLPDGSAIGRVRAVPEVGGQDMLEVERPGRAEALVPLHPSFLREVDLEGRRVVIDPPEGLLDLDLPEPGSRRGREAADAQAAPGTLSPTEAAAAAPETPPPAAAEPPAARHPS